MLKNCSQLPKVSLLDFFCINKERGKYSLSEACMHDRNKIAVKNMYRQLLLILGPTSFVYSTISITE